jgi:hypothetical protein
LAFFSQVMKGVRLAHEFAEKAQAIALTVEDLHRRGSQGLFSRILAKLQNLGAQVSLALLNLESDDAPPFVTSDQIGLSGHRHPPLRAPGRMHLVLSGIRQEMAVRKPQPGGDQAAADLIGEKFLQQRPARDLPATSWNQDHNVSRAGSRPKPRSRPASSRRSCLSCSMERMLRTAISTNT